MVTKGLSSPAVLGKAESGGERERGVRQNKTVFIQFVVMA